MSRLPIRARLTVAFAVAMVLVLAGAGQFVYQRLKADLDESLSAGLNTRVAAVAASGSAAAGAADDSEEGFAQLVDADGRVLDAAGGARGQVLSDAELERAAGGERVLLDRRVPDVEGEARVVARPVEEVGTGASVVVVGQSLDDRDETLSGLVASFAIGGPIAVLVASLLGYALATAGLRPVEAMRRRAEDVSLSDGDERLPLPAARDEIRRLGETLNEMLDRLRRSFERERRFVADASHELRTPVAVIKTELESALRAGGHDPRVRVALVAAVEECDHLAQLAEDLLVVARSAEGELPVRPERVSASDLLGGVRERFADRAHERGRAITLEAVDGLQLDADPLRMRQALGNLVDNALRHGEGEIVLGARAVDDGPVELWVADEGPGIPPELATAPSSASRAGTSPARAAAPGSGWRSCGRSRRRTAAPRRSWREPVGSCGSRFRTADKPLRAISAGGPTVLLDCQPEEATDMRDKLKGAIVAAAAIAALAVGGAAIAGAAGGGDDDASDKAIGGQALDRASAAALQETGGGKVTETEVGDEESYYEVEVTRGDGSQVDVQLDRDFQVVGQSADREDADGGDDR